MKKTDRFLENNKIYNVINLLAAILLFAVMCWGLIYKLFWYDEMATLGFMRSSVSFKDMINYYLTIEASNLPMNQIICWPVYRLLPASNFSALFPMMIMTAAGVYFLSKLADKVFGRVAAYVTIILSITSTTVVNRIGLLCRAYALMFFATVLVLYFIYEFQNKRDVKTGICLTASAILLEYSHYFGTLLFGILCLIAFIAFLLKKNTFKMLIPYVVAGVTFIPWFLAAMRTRVAKVDDFWIEAPKLKNVVETIGYLLGANVLMCLIWGLGFVVSIIVIVKKKEIISYKCMYVIMPVLVIGAMFVYSNIGGSLYENRYFIILLPELQITAAALFQHIYDGFKGKKGCTFIYAFSGIVILAVAIMLFERCHYGVTVQYDRYVFPASYIIDENDIASESTLLAISDYTDVDVTASLGWYDFYLCKRGYEAANLEADTGGIDEDILEPYGGKIDKIYCMAPVEEVDLEDDSFEMVYQDDVYKLTVFERKK